MITAQKRNINKPVALVAGGADFIGSFLCEALILHGCRVICLDNLSDKKKENLKKCFASEDFVFYEHDLTKPFKKTEEIAYIFHLSGHNQATKNFLRLAKENKAKFLEVRDLIKRKNFSFKDVDARVIYVADVYGPRMNFQENLSVQLIKAKISSFSSPLFISDIVYGIIKAMFTSGTEGQSFDLSQKENSNLNWQPKIDIEEGLEETLKFFERKPQRLQKPQKRQFRLWLCLGFLIILFPFVSLMIDAFWGGINLKKAQKGARYALKAKSSFARVEKKIHFFSPVFNFIGQKKMVGQGEELFYLAKVASDGLFHLGLAAEKADSLRKIVLQNSTGNLSSLASEIAANLDYGYYQLSLVEAGLEKSKLKGKVADWYNLLPEARSLIFQAKKAVLLMPSLTGIDGKKTYLVLLQNNHELRPTGGFIGSFALVTFDKGKLIDFEVKDVYSADGQLKGHVEPPEALKKYLGEANWFLRDSNWDPDFSVSAKRASWFLEKETGRVVDGVLGVNLLLAQKILAAVGEIDVVDFGEKINTTNLFERAEYHSEVGFFPGSTRKQDFLGSLTRSLFEKLKNSNKSIWLDLFRAFYQSFKAKDLLVWLNEPEAMAVINELEWDGIIKKVSCQLTDSEGKFKCLADYLMIVEANVGVNKANYFVQRSLFHQVDFLDDGSVKKNLKINYQNSSPAEVFPGGNYKNYLRILTPLGSKLEKVLINKQAVEREKIDEGTLCGKTFFGFLVEVPIKESRLVEVSYQLSDQISAKQVTQYALLIQKQSGIKDEKIDFWLKTPAGMDILPVFPPTLPSTQPLFFSPVFNQDIALEVSLVKK